VLGSSLVSMVGRIMLTTIARKLSESAGASSLLLLLVQPVAVEYTECISEVEVEVDFVTDGELASVFRCLVPI
jgi:hypothetical protein